ncbi:MAG: YtxH domain-containing protein [Anaerolineae bacterium]
MLGSLIRFVGGVVVGASTGSALAALLTPKSGEQLKNDARAYWEQVKQAGVDAETMRRLELQTKFRKAKIL